MMIDWFDDDWFDWLIRFIISMMKQRKQRLWRNHTVIQLIALQDCFNPLIYCEKRVRSHFWNNFNYRAKVFLKNIFSIRDDWWLIHSIHSTMLPVDWRFIRFDDSFDKFIHSPWARRFWLTIGSSKSELGPTKIEVSREQPNSDGSASQHPMTGIIP